MNVAENEVLCPAVIKTVAMTLYIDGSVDDGGGGKVEAMVRPFRVSFIHFPSVSPNNIIEIRKMCGNLSLPFSPANIKNERKSDGISNTEKS